MKKNMIPNLLTLIRMCLVPVMILLQILKLYKITIVLVILGALTDFFDGRLARKWNVVSEKGKKLDELADKVFSAGLLICLIFKYKVAIILLVLEALIGLLNVYYYKKTKNAETLMIGKIKTTFLFTLIALFFFSIVNNSLNFLHNGLMYATCNLQVLCIISYFANYYKYIHKDDIVENKEEEKPKNSKKKKNDNKKKTPTEKKELTDTIIVSSINDLYDKVKKDDF